MFTEEIKPRVKYIPVRKIKSDSSLNDDSIDRLAESIRETGLLQPLTVRKEGKAYVLLCGRRRFAALKRLGAKNVPCLISAADENIAFLAENLCRDERDFIAVAEKTSEELKKSGNISDLSRKIGIKSQKVEEIVSPTLLSGELLYVLRENGFGSEYALLLSRLESDAERTQLLREIISRGLSVRGAAKAGESLFSKKEKPFSAEKGEKHVYILKDVRVFLNTVERAVELLRKYGIDAALTEEKTENGVSVNVKIPRSLPKHLTEL